MTVSVNKGLLKKIIGQAKSKLTLGGRDESEMDNLEKKYKKGLTHTGFLY